MRHEIGNCHVASEDKGNGSGEQTQREQHLAPFDFFDCFSEAVNRVVLASAKQDKLESGATVRITPPPEGKPGDAKPLRLPKQDYAAWRSSRYSS
jgi:hypothetical protein